MREHEKTAKLHLTYKSTHQAIEKPRFEENNIAAAVIYSHVDLKFTKLQTDDTIPIKENIYNLLEEDQSWSSC